MSLGILIDSSGSMYDKRAAVDAASINLVQLSNRQDEAFLVDFSSEAYIDQDFTSDIKKLQQGLSYIKVQRRHGDLRRCHRLGGLPEQEQQAHQAGAAHHHGRRGQRVEREPGAGDPARAGPRRAGHLLHRAAVRRGYGPARGAPREAKC